MRMSYANAFYQDGSMHPMNFQARTKRGLITEARAAINDGRIASAEVITCNRCSCGCGGAHPDSDINILELKA